MLSEDAPLLRRLGLELRTEEAAVLKYGRWTKEGARAEGKIERLRSHIDQVQTREAEEFWAEHQPLLQAAPQIEEHFPDVLEELEVFDPARRCPKCRGKAKAMYEPDRLKRVCRRCTYSWYERPLDSDPVEEQTAPDE